MCYLVREHRAGAAERGGAALPPGLERLRPRWIGAVGAALVGGLAVAAIVAPPLGSPPAKANDPAAPATFAAKAVPTQAIAQQGSSTPVDDGVPGATDRARAGLGHCDHDL